MVLKPDTFESLKIMDLDLNIELFKENISFFHNLENKVPPDDPNYQLKVKKSTLAITFDFSNA